jgi:hypothetical protein
LFNDGLNVHVYPSLFNAGDGDDYRL